MRPGTRRAAIVGSMLGGIILLSALQAAGANTTLTVRASVVLSAPCVINGNKPIEIDFGDSVMTNRIDGVNFKEPVNYTLVCSGLKANALRLRIQGNAASFNHELLGTNKSGLGIALLHNDVRLPIGAFLDFSYPALPALYAVPVRQTGIKLIAGEFSAAATLEVVYQ